MFSPTRIILTEQFYASVIPQSKRFRRQTFFAENELAEKCKIIQFLKQEQNRLHPKNNIVCYHVNTFNLRNRLFFRGTEDACFSRKARWAGTSTAEKCTGELGTQDASSDCLKVHEELHRSGRVRGIGHQHRSSPLCSQFCSASAERNREERGCVFLFSLT